MKIKDIYQKYPIPINLQEHMFRVAAVSSIICNNLNDVTVDKDLIIKTSLMHDMGNIIKFDFNKIDLLDDKDKVRVNELKLARSNFIEKYGNDTDEATLKIIEEVVPNSTIVNLCKNSHWEYTADFLDTDFWDRKIVCYADMRIGPFGIMTLNDRFSNLEKRRPEEIDSLKILRRQGIELEKEIQGVLAIDFQSITDEMIREEISELEEIDV